MASTEVSPTPGISFLKESGGAFSDTMSRCSQTLIKHR